MNRTTIGLVWLGGIVLMLALYVIGPQDFLANLENAISVGWQAMATLIARLSVEALNLLRAAAIALFVVFLVLAVMARRQGMRVGAAVLTISVLFLVLADTDWYEPGTKWFTAALLAAVGAVMMTGRLLRPPPPRDAEHPWMQRPFYHDGRTG